MIDFLYSIDVSVFYFINHSIANPVFDKFFVFITEVKHWYLVYIILLGISIVYGGRTGRIAAAGAIILITISDQFSSFTLKDLFTRIRPCNVLPDVRDLTGCSDSYSFPSSHAVNNFAIFIFYTRIYPNLKWVLFISAFLVSLSRVYIGRHYPSDIIGGAIIGMAIGYGVSSLALLTDKYFRNKYRVNIPVE